jgi:hypothetical protein
LCRFRANQCGPDNQKKLLDIEAGLPHKMKWRAGGEGPIRLVQRELAPRTRDSPYPT